jgi:ParB family transcriptional regulator, chromosome partitioning protein
MELEFHQLDLRYEHLRVRRPDKERRLLSSLAESGQQVPIVVVAVIDQPNRFLVVDGFKRIRALRRLKQDTLQATVWDMTETEALLLHRSMRTAEAETALEQGWLLVELYRGFGLSFEDLARRFNRSTSWVSRRLALVEELPASVQEKVRRGQIGATAAMKYLVPMARAKGEDCERLAEAIVHYKFSSQEVGQLYAAWRDGPLPLRLRALDDPKLFLRACREMQETDPPEVRPAEGLFRDLELVSAVARRASRQWRQVADMLDPAEREQLALCLQQALDDLEKLSRRMKKECAHVESESADSNPGAFWPGREPSPDCTGPSSLPHGSQESHPLAIVHSPTDLPCRESRRLPARDPAALCFLPRESGPSP